MSAGCRVLRDSVILLRGVFPSASAALTLREPKVEPSAISVSHGVAHLFHASELSNLCPATSQRPRRRRHQPVAILLQEFLATLDPNLPATLRGVVARSLSLLSRFHGNPPRRRRRCDAPYRLLNAKVICTISFRGQERRLGQFLCNSGDQIHWCKYFVLNQIHRKIRGCTSSSLRTVFEGRANLFHMPILGLIPVELCDATMIVLQHVHQTASLSNRIKCVR